MISNKTRAMHFIHDQKLVQQISDVNPIFVLTPLEWPEAGVHGNSAV